MRRFYVRGAAKLYLSAWMSYILFLEAELCGSACDAFLNSVETKALALALKTAVLVNARKLEILWWVLGAEPVARPGSLQEFEASAKARVVTFLNKFPTILTTFNVPGP